MTKTLAGGLLALAAGAALGAESVQAQQQPQPFLETRACEGEISSQSLDPIPDGQTYWVDIFDQTDEALRFRTIFLERLNETGRPTGEEGGLVFNFASESIFYGITPRSRVLPTPGQDSGASRSGRGSDLEETRELIQRDRRPERGLPSASQEVIVEAELREKPSQRVIWLATVRCLPTTQDRTLVMRFVSAAIIDHLGQNNDRNEL